jgi:hypothetical protein
MDNFAQFYQEGGAYMHAIALTAVLGAGVMIERFIFLFFRFNINGGQFFNQIQKLVMATTSIAPSSCATRPIRLRSHA